MMDRDEMAKMKKGGMGDEKMKGNMPVEAPMPIPGTDAWRRYRGHSRRDARLSEFRPDGADACAHERQARHEQHGARFATSRISRRISRPTRVIDRVPPRSPAAHHTVHQTADRAESHQGEVAF